MMVVETLLGGKMIVNWTGRDVVPADCRTRVFTPTQWEALFPPPLDVDE